MRYKFGQCELTPAARELVVAGGRRAGEAQVFDPLHNLVEEDDRGVSTDELIDIYWKGRTCL